MFFTPFSPPCQEPYYMSFVNTDFKRMFADVGMRHESTVLAHVTKVRCHAASLNLCSSYWMGKMNGQK